MEQPRRLFKCSRKNFRCQKYVKKGYIEMTKKIYLEPQESVLGRSILHYCSGGCNVVDRCIEVHMFPNQFLQGLLEIIKEKSR